MKKKFRFHILNEFLRKTHTKFDRSDTHTRRERERNFKNIF